MVRNTKNSKRGSLVNWVSDHIAYLSKHKLEADDFENSV